MPDLTIEDSYGVYTYPEEIGDARYVFDEVCGDSDTYGFVPLFMAHPNLQVLVDIGASWGVASRVMRKLWPHADVIAFEGAPDRYHYAVKNAPGAFVHNVGVIGYYPDRARAVPFLGYQAPYRNAPELLYDEVVGLKWRLASVKTAFAGVDRIDLLKIDCEGFEWGILDEMFGLGLFPKFIRGEWHMQNVRKGLSDLLAPLYHTTFLDRGNWDTFTAERKD